MIPWQDFIFGIIGGFVPTLILHPFDLIKVRLQVNDVTLKRNDNIPRYRGALHAFNDIRSKNGLRGLYQGATPNLVGNALAWGTYFFVFRLVKQFYEPDQKTGALSFYQHASAAMVSGVVTQIVTNPIWVAKTRMCLRYNNEKEYASLASTFRTILSKEGPSALYKGFAIGLVGTTHGIIQFTAYEQMKSYRNIYAGRNAEAKLATYEYLCLSAASKVLAVVITYPYQVIRSRLQEQHRSYGGIRDCASHIKADGGLRGFYRGLTPALARVVPSAALTFVIYETLRNLK